MPLPNKPILLATDGRHPWEQQPTEGRTRFAQFIAFREQGLTRTIDKVCERFNITRASARQYARIYHWHERCTAYDKHIEEQWVLALREHTRTMVQRHLLMGEKVRVLVMDRLTTLKAEQLTPTELYRLAELYSKLTRTALGEPDQHIAVTGKSGAVPLQVTTVPGDENTREAQMRQATYELAQRLGLDQALELDAEAVLELPE
ncbi:MAG TPA: hypothetical protein VIM84_14085 [Gemmatimonadales bacterium]